MTLSYGLASTEAALYAVKNWHYSRKLPAGKAIRIGVWEDGKYIGVVIFSRGATATLASPYGLTQTEACELTRVALNTHKAPVSEIIAHGLKYLKETNPGIRLVISFADPTQGHHGGIYQAGNWIYTGKAPDTTEIVIKGIQYHTRSLNAKYGTCRLDWIHTNLDPKAYKVVAPGKHRYIMPLDKQTRRRVKSHAKPYPARAV